MNPDAEVLWLITGAEGVIVGSSLLVGYCVGGVP
jgi:hypothetical protein